MTRSDAQQSGLLSLIFSTDEGISIRQSHTQCWNPLISLKWLSTKTQFHSVIHIEKNETRSSQLMKEFQFDKVMCIRQNHKSLNEFLSRKSQSQHCPKSTVNATKDIKIYRISIHNSDLSIGIRSMTQGNGS
jgi:hypothetical protein